MAIDPASGKLYVSNTDANNLEPNEPDLVGELHRAAITVIDPAGNVNPRLLNKHINYNIVPSPPGTADASLAIPTGMAIASDGTLYVAAFGSVEDRTGSRRVRSTTTVSPRGRLST